jgi:hypothetical protein
MVMYWIKNRTLVNLITSTALIALIVFGFVFPYLQRALNEYNEISTYENTDIDFDVPDPSIEQVSVLMEEPFISALYPYYMDALQVEVNRKTRTTNVIMADISLGSFAMYNPARLIEKIEYSYESNQAFVDFEFQKSTGAKLGDTLTFDFLGQEFSFKIVAVYETNTRFLNNGAIAVNLTLDLKKALGEERSYSSAFIVAQNYNQCYNYLKDEYRPLGRLRDREKFNSAEDYERHVAVITERTYEREIVFFKDQIPNYRNNYMMIWVYLGGFLVFGVVLNLILSRRKSEKGYLSSYIQSGGKAKKYYLLTCVYEITVNMGLLILMFFIIKIIYKDYFVPGVIKPTIIYLLATSLIISIMNLILNLRLLRNKRGQGMHG